MNSFLPNLHIKYLSELESPGFATMSSFRAESLRLGGVFWAVSSMQLLSVEISTEKRSKIFKFIYSCWDETVGAFAWSTGHDGHIASTHYALLILRNLNLSLDEPKRKKISKFVAQMQKFDGSFQGDVWGETDLRFSYDAFSIFALLDERVCANACRCANPCESGEDDLVHEQTRVNAAEERDSVNEQTHVYHGEKDSTHSLRSCVSSCVYSRGCAWILSCQNFDGGFGPVPNLESHAAYTFCAIGALSICKVKVPLKPQLIHWLCERQTVSGGFNGRPEKAPDVCYSWWITSTLEMLGSTHLIDKNALVSFILKSQDSQNGGIADRPECVPDVFHTFFGMAGLSLLDKSLGLKEIDPMLVTIKHL